MRRHRTTCRSQAWVLSLVMTATGTIPLWGEPQVPGPARAPAMVDQVAAKLEPQEAEQAGPARGRELFTYEWQPRDPRSPQGDGLGPVYNARSCVSCHKQGGVGGSSGNEQNVLVLTRLSPQAANVAVSFQFGGGADQLNGQNSGFFFQVLPGSNTKVSSVLHRFGISPTYEPWRTDRVQGVSLRPPAGTDFPRNAGLRYGQAEDGSYFLSQRNAPALFGARQIDQIPAESLHNLATVQAADQDGIAGQVPVVGQSVGRFGWRGQIATLRDFVESACANELGLHVPGQPQANDPSSPELRPRGLDLQAHQVDDLTEFVASLPAPTAPHELNKAELEGQQVFRRVGCATCHVEDAHQVVGIYSDLLLHEMGTRLADAPTESSANPFLAGLDRIGPNPFQDANRNFLAFPISPADYLGAVQSFQGVSKLSDVWRTPPLWGVADSAPYLHDGRAPTLAAAIALHGGEASRVVARYRRLPAASKRSLITFLEGLRSPNLP